MASGESGLGAMGAPDSSAPVPPTHAPTSTAAPLDSIRELLWQCTLMGPPRGSRLEGVLGQAATVAPGTTAPTAPSRAASPAVDPTETSPRIPWREFDAVHQGP
jgi:hypothetical protein